MNKYLGYLSLCGNALAYPDSVIALEKFFHAIHSGYYESLENDAVYASLKMSVSNQNFLKLKREDNEHENDENKARGRIFRTVSDGRFGGL